MLLKNLSATYIHTYVLALIVVSLICLASCQPSKDTDEATVPSRSRNGRSADELVVSMGEILPGEFDPRQNYGVHNEAHITHSTLLRRTADIKFVPDFAKSYTISPDGLVWSFDLRDDFKFSNGESVTAEDVKFTYEMLIEDGRHWDMGFIDKIEIPEEHKIVFYLKNPRSTFTSNLSEVPILPRNHYDDNYKFNPIGSGPYVCVEYRPGEQAVFEINPYYHGEKPYFKKWTWVLLNENTALAALKAGHVDIIYAVPELADERIEGCKLFSVESNDVRGLSMPYVKKGVITDSPDGYAVGNDITSDPVIRKALNIGLNRKKVANIVLNGHGKPAYSNIELTPFWHPETTVEDGRVEDARKLLEDDGWTLGQDGVFEKDGKKAEFDLYYPTNDVVRTNIAIEAATQAEALGIKINTVASNWDEMVTKCHEHSLLYGGGRHHANQFYTTFHSSTAGLGWTNITHYNNPHVERILEEAMSSADLKKANELWKKAQWDGKQGASVLGDAPYVWLIRLDHTYVGDERLNVGEQGVHSHGHDWALLHNIYDWKWEIEPSE